MRMRRHMTPIRSPHEAFIDTCGTGGVGSQTFNVSTTAAIVTAAAGVPVAKHGNRSVTSRSGSADVLAALGVNIEADVPIVERCLDELGLCFCFAPLLHPAMKHVVGRPPEARRAARSSICSGRSTNPAGAPFQVLGSGAARAAREAGRGAAVARHTALVRRLRAWARRSELGRPYLGGRSDAGPLAGA